MARRGAPHAEEENSERWLLTFADMMTLLVALFIVLFSISSVNVSKLETVQRSLDEAFSGSLLPGGQGPTEGSAGEPSKQVVPPPFMAAPSSAPQDEATTTQDDSSADRRELEQVERRVTAAAADAGLSGRVSTRTSGEGLRVRILSDDVLFASGSAALTRDGTRLLDRLAASFSDDSHALVVEGHTDAAPIRSAQYPSNWELSSARASAVVRALADDGVAPRRMTAAGRADLDPVAQGDDPTARGLNRRVEILLPRRAGA